MKNRPNKTTTAQNPTSSMALALYRAVKVSGQIRASK